MTLFKHASPGVQAGVSADDLHDWRDRGAALVLRLLAAGIVVGTLGALLVEYAEGCL